jgi:uncharacterized protein YfeS
MKVQIDVETYNASGGDETTTLAAEFLSGFLEALPPTDLQVVLTACFRSSGKPARTLQSMWRDFHDSLAGLPAVRWSPKRSRLDVRFVSRVPAEQVLDVAEPELVVFQAIVLEAAVMLLSTLSEHKAMRKAVPLRALESALSRAQEELPTTVSELRHFATEQQGRAIATAALLSPWDKLGIDWAQFHPAARRLLDDPFFWDSVDEYAPHGNDTGADLLDAFREWRRGHAKIPASRFLPLMLKRWNYSSGVALLLDKPMSQWDDDDELMLEVIDEANIAIAFAQMKIEGRCDEDLREAALLSIERQLDPAVHAHFAWSLPLEHRDRLEQLRAKLSAG